MPRILREDEVDLESEVLDGVMTAAEEAETRVKFGQPVAPSGDLSDGGQVGIAKIFPTQGGKRILKGRAVARRAWMWDGTETLLPLSWDPAGKRHDGARSYMTKKHCLCCGTSGFRDECRTCIGRNCNGCGAGTDKKKLIPCFYLRKELVPFQQKFYGEINCFIPICPRQGSQGFKTEEDMRMHARTRHRMEYATRQEIFAQQKSDETGALRSRVDELTRLLMAQNGDKPKRVLTAEQKQRNRVNLAKGRAAKKAKRA